MTDKEIIDWLNHCRMEPNEYQCARCLEVFEKAWTDEEAEAEAAENGFQGMDTCVVCDDCYNLLMRRTHQK
jgi:hypothetical protein